jgi:mannosyltransferase
MPIVKHALTRTMVLPILLLAMGLRFHDLAGQSLWSDEGNSIVLARAALSEIVTRTALDIHPPLYYWLLHGWIRIAGDSEVAVRSLSSFASVLLVAVTYRLGRRLLGRQGGLIAAFAMAMSPFQVHYAQETRMYALLALLGGVTIWAAVELATRCTGQAIQRHRNNLGWVALYVLAAAMGLYTHYAFPVILVTTTLAGAFFLWRRPRGDPGGVARRTAIWVMCQLVPIALYLPWMPAAWRQLGSWPVPVRTEAGQVLTTIWHTLTMGPGGGHNSSMWLAVFAFLGLVGFLRLVRRGSMPGTALVALYMGLPIALTAVLFKPAYLKFLLVAGPAWCLLEAAALTAPRGTGARIRMLAALVPCLGCSLLAAAAWSPLSAYYTDPTVARDDYRGLARYLEAVGGPHDSILLDAPGQQEVFGYYYHGDAEVYPLPRSRPLDGQATILELESILAHSHAVYAIYWATEESDPSGLIESWLNANAFEAAQWWVGNLRLATYGAPLPPGEWFPLEARLGEHINLTGYRVAYPSARDGSSVAEAGDILQVQLRWQADSPLHTEHKIFLQALDAANHVVGQRDAPSALSGTVSLINQPVLDRGGVLILPGTPLGEHRLIAGLYDPVSGERVPVSMPDASPTDFVTLDVFTVVRPAKPPALAALRLHHTVNALLGPFRLLGYDCYKPGHDSDVAVSLHPGDPLHVVLAWQATGQPDRDWNVILGITTSGGTDSPNGAVYDLAGTDDPTARWQAGDVVRAQYDLFVPPAAAPGAHSLDVRLSDDAGRPGTEFNLVCPFRVESD